MIKRLYRIEAEGTIPYRNMALERYLLEHADAAGCVLYLWRNEKTVVIGRNQNAWKECNCALLEQDGGFLARRLSGGGAVYHDEGNLNFTFVCTKENFDVARQTGVILDAVRRAGIPAESAGRNDITVEGKKFSGNAYYRTAEGCFHHGTLLISSDTAEFGRYLTVSNDKLAAKGVDSVRSRVTTLCAINPGLTMDTIKDSLFTSFQSVYKAPLEPYPEKNIDEKRLSSLEEEFGSWDWKYGRAVPFTAERSRRFGWGGVEVQLQITGGSVADAAVWTDALDCEIAGKTQSVLRNIRFCAPDIARVLASIDAPDTGQREMIADIQQLLEEML